MENTKTALSAISSKTRKKSLLAKFKIRIEVSFLTIITIFFALLTNYYPYLFLMYLIALTHELSHVFWAVMFKAKVNRIRFLPFGFFAEITGLNRLSSVKELIILAAGPLSYFLSYILLRILKVNGTISFYAYSIAQNANLITALFNLIPYYPLDGARMVEILIARLVPEKTTRYVRLLISAVMLILISVFLYMQDQFFLMFYLLSLFAVEVIFFKKNYRVFLMQRLIEGPPEKTKFIEKDEIYRYHHTYRIERKRILDEQVIIKRILNRIRAKRGDKRSVLANIDKIKTRNLEDKNKAR